MKRSQFKLPLLLVLGCLSQGSIAICQSSPKNVNPPSTTYNYYYSGNWYYSFPSPIPRISGEQYSERPRHDPNDAETATVPVDTKDHGDPAAEKTDNQKQPATESVKVVAAVPVKRDGYDIAFIFFTASLALVTAFQGILLFWAYVADHRPRLEIAHVGLLTEPDNMIASGAGQAVPIDTMVVVVNRGGTRARVVEANITIKVIGGNGIEDILMRRPLLPQFDRSSGLPMYEKSGLVVLEKRVIQSSERRNIKGTMPVLENIAGQVRAYLATHPTRGASSTWPCWYLDILDTTIGKDCPIQRVFVVATTKRVRDLS
jgi:hypothetical protein